MLIKRKNYFFLLIVFLLITGCGNHNKEVVKEPKYGYLSSKEKEIKLLDTEYKESKKVVRGQKIEIVSEEENYYKVKYNDEDYSVTKENIVDSELDVVREKELYVRTPITVYKDENSISILGTIKKGSKVNIIGYDKLNEDGSVNKYKIEYNNTYGYVRAKYLVDTEESAKKLYDYNDSLKKHASMGDTLGGGKATELDYYPYPKADFSDNKMPKEVRALYINAGAIKDVDKYIALAKKININAFVVDIKDDTAPAYPANAMKKYSKTNYDKAINTYDDYKNYIKKLKDNGFYVIGRITLFKDAYFVKDNPSVAIM